MPFTSSSFVAKPPAKELANEVRPCLDELNGSDPEKFRSLFILEDKVSLTKAIAAPLSSAGIVQPSPTGFQAAFRIMGYDTDLYALSDFCGARDVTRVYPAYQDQGVRFAEHLTAGPGEEILDIGTGSGVLAFRLAKLGARVTGIDINPRSIEMAEFGASLNGVADRTTFRHQSFKDVKGQFNLIVSNPPFAPIPEPNAWFWNTGRDGLNVFREIIAVVPALLANQDARLEFLINSLGDDSRIQSLTLLRDSFTTADIHAMDLFIPSSIRSYEHARRFRNSPSYGAWLKELRSAGLTRMYRHIVTVKLNGAGESIYTKGLPHQFEYIESFEKKPKVVEPYESGGWDEMLGRYGHRGSADQVDDPRPPTIDVLLIEDDESFVAALTGLLRVKGVDCSTCPSLPRIRHLLSNLGNENEVRRFFGSHRFVLLDMGLAPSDRKTYDDACRDDLLMSVSHGTKHTASDLLEELSGIKILRAIQRSPVLSKQIKVILISRYDEKFLATKALDASAYAFISKYTDYRPTAGYLGSLTHHQVMSCHLKSLFRGEALADEIRHTLEKAANDLALRSLVPHVPSTVSEWIASNKTDLIERDRVNATLLLADIAGSSALLQATASGRTDLFRILLNAILSHAHERVVDCGGEINAFTGDGLLAFFGIYSTDDDHLGSALQAALDIRDTFRRRTIPEIERIIDSKVPGEVEQASIKRIVANRLGIRLGIITTDEAASVTAKVGGNDRCQHTIISPQMNVLSRALDALGGAVRDASPDSRAEQGLVDPIILVTQHPKSSTNSLRDFGLTCRDFLADVQLRDFSNYSVLLIEDPKATEAPQF